MKAELQEIRQIRVKNNDLWLSILEIALRRAPDETKEVLNEIRLNDMMITEIVGEIIDEDS